MAAIEADRGLEFSAHTLPPTSLGTALPFELVTECLRALDDEYSRWNAPMRLATMRAISLCSKAWHPLGQCFLYSQVGVTLRPSGVTTTPTTSRSLQLLATLLAKRPLASLMVTLTLCLEGARAIDLLAVTSLFDDLHSVLYCEISFGDHEVRHIADKLGLLRNPDRLMLQGPVTPSLARALFTLERVAKLRISGPFPDTCCSSQPAFTLRQLILERETSITSFHTLTSYAIFTLQHQTLTASDSQEPPSLSWFLCLRTLIILQPYRGSKHAQRSRRLEGDEAPPMSPPFSAPLADCPSSPLSPSATRTNSATRAGPTCGGARLRSLAFCLTALLAWGSAPPRRHSISGMLTTC